MAKIPKLGRVIAREHGREGSESRTTSPSNGSMTRATGWSAMFQLIGWKAAAARDRREDAGGAQ